MNHVDVDDINVHVVMLVYVKHMFTFVLNMSTFIYVELISSYVELNKYYSQELPIGTTLRTPYVVGVLGLKVELKIISSCIITTLKWLLQNSPFSDERTFAEPCWR